MLKISAFYLVKQKSFISKKNMIQAVVNIKTKKLCLLTQFSATVLHKGFTNVTILEKSNRVGGMVDHVDLRGTRMTFHLWSSRYYNKTLVPLLDKFGFGPDIIQKSRDQTLFWPTNDANVRGERAFLSSISFPVFKTIPSKAK